MSSIVVRRLLIMKETNLPILTTIVLIFAFVMPALANAQDVSLGTATMVQMTDKGAGDGDIVSTQNGGGYKRSAILYDPFMFGVVTLNPAVYLYDKSLNDGLPVINSGKAYVRVSSLNGDIKRGDSLTSSIVPGVAVKATDNGYILGTAEEPYVSSDKKKVSKILVTVDPHFAQINNNLAKLLFSVPQLGFSAAILSPITALRYLLAALIAAASFFLGFRFFGHASTKGVEAIGRNPLARQMILVSVGVNAALTVGVMLFGFVVAYIILAL